jgi:hypothetical protein
LKRGRARHDVDAPHAGERDGDLIRHSVREEILRRIVGSVF